MLVFALYADGLAIPVPNLSGVDWTDGTEVLGDTCTVTSTPGPLPAVPDPERLVIVPTARRDGGKGMVFGPYDVESNRTAQEAGITTWHGVRGREFHSRYAELADAEEVLQEVGFALRRLSIAGAEPWASWLARTATNLTRVEASIRAQTFNSTGLADMRTELEKWGITLLAEIRLDAPGRVIMRGTDTLSINLPLHIAARPRWPADAAPYKQSAYLMDWTASAVTRHDSDTRPVPLTLPVDVSEWQIEVPDRWNRPGTYRRRRIISSHHTIGTGVILFQDQGTDRRLPPIYVGERTAGEWALQAIELERWRLQSMARSARVVQAIPYWHDDLADELTLQPLDLITHIDRTWRVAQAQHRWAADTGYRRELELWQFQGYAGA